jgi:uncharacterized protein YjiS (DUF1127 family)
MSGGDQKNCAAAGCAAASDAAAIVRAAKAWRERKRNVIE